MLFSRFIFVSSALFASASAFSIQGAKSMPKTALYASNDNGALERRQVLASLGLATVAGLGASAANAISGTDVKDAASKAVDNIKGDSIDMSMDKNLSMGGNTDVEKAKDAGKEAFSFPNPFAKREADKLASKVTGGGRDVARKGKESSDNADSSNMSNNPFSGTNANSRPTDTKMNPLNNMSTMNSENPVTSSQTQNSNPIKQGGFVANSPGSMEKKGNEMDMNMPNSPGDAVNKVKDAVTGGGSNLFSNVQTSTSTNLPTSPLDKNSNIGSNQNTPSDDALNLNSLKTPNPFSTAMNN